MEAISGKPLREWGVPRGPHDPARRPGRLHHDRRLARQRAVAEEVPRPK